MASSCCCVSNLILMAIRWFGLLLWLQNREAHSLCLPLHRSIVDSRLFFQSRLPSHWGSLEDAHHASSSSDKSHYPRRCLFHVNTILSPSDNPVPCGGTVLHFHHPPDPPHNPELGQSRNSYCYHANISGPRYQHSSWLRQPPENRYHLSIGISEPGRASIVLDWAPRR